MARGKKDEDPGPEPPEGPVAATDGQPHNDELERRRRQRSGGSLAERDANGELDGEGDGEDGGQTELPLNLPGSSPARSGLKGIKTVSVEGKLMRTSVKQLGGEIRDADQIVELRVLARLDHNEEVPVRDGSGETATTQSVIKRQHLRVLRIEVLQDARSAEAQAAQG